MWVTKRSASLLRTVAVTRVDQHAWADRVGRLVPRAAVVAPVEQQPPLEKAAEMREVVRVDLVLRIGIEHGFHVPRHPAIPRREPISPH